ncbi:MAG: hypothetical protein H6838_11390 [Planctomycetes bacterium]|nr:hypothetical protein [Planctomycetota bacterium]MCB9886088.1 hypothetical protein [Planctomycetota bacterium]
MRLLATRGSAFLLGLLPLLAQQAVHGRIDTHEGLRVVHVWGTDQERGYAHGFLLGKDIAAVLTAEFSTRFSRMPGLLKQARAALGRVVTYPDDVRTEIEAVYAGLVAAGVSRAMPELDREFDLDDLLVANALDVFGLMGCSGFTVWGDQVVGGGVLTGRNFDWPFTGDHMLDSTVLLVQHLPGGRAVASVSWPGFVGSVTAVSSDGVAAFLHVGTGKITRTPEPESWPTAVAAQLALRAFAPADPDAGFAKVQDLLGYTSPPAGYLTRIVLPAPPADAPPLALFETDAKKCVRAPLPASPCVVTNHFQSRQDGRGASRDSRDRAKKVRAGIDACLGDGDHKVSIEEAWQMLGSVQRGGGHAFGTLHSLVFRHEPWCFELRLAEHGEKGLVGAPGSDRRHTLPRSVVFPADLAK